MFVAWNLRCKILTLCEQKTMLIAVAKMMIKMMMQIIVVGVSDWGTMAFPDKNKPAA